MTASIQRVKASAGSGNASVATVQSVRAISATTLIVDTVLGINGSGFMASMGTPHTFTDPITSEVITVISEATAVDFAGHVNGSNLEIDTIAPGYTDAGSKIGDIVIIRPTTQYADNLAAALDVAHNDDGSLDGTAVRTALGETAASGAGWTLLANTPNTITALGNKSRSMVFNGVDLTGTLSPGMRLRTTRTVAAPTQCTSLNGTTQFYSKTSPAGMTFTDDFTVSGYIKLTSYGAISTIASRYNGTSGWWFYVDASGLITLRGINGGAANLSQVASYQSVPLNKWVHVQANLDMSAFTTNTDGGASGSTIALDGANIPASVSRAGTNPTALIQAGNLEIGSTNGGTSPFPGKLAQIAVWSSKITIATMQGYISQGLAGTETSLISAYNFNNSINDLNANANNLTANGSAVATNADSPFGGQADGTISSTLDYAIVTKAAFSTNTTLTVQVPEGCTIPTSGGVSAVSYATVKAPYGMPVSRTKWDILSPFIAPASQSSPVSGTWYNPGGLQVTAPVGEWDLEAEIQLTGQRTAGQIVINGGFSTANNSNTETDTTKTVGGSSLANQSGAVRCSKSLSLASQTTYYYNLETNQAMTSIGTNNDAGTSILKLRNAYL